jgi:hypothetical protein
VDTLVGILQQRTNEQVRSDVLIIDDLECFHTSKLWRLQHFENSLVETLVLTESTGIEVWEIFHSLKSSKLRPHFKAVFFNGSFATPTNFDTLNAKLPLASCTRLAESMWVQKAPIRLAGDAMMVGNVDGFLAPFTTIVGVWTSAVAWFSRGSASGASRLPMPMP